MPELYINDDNINYLDNCDYLSISKLTIFVPNNINFSLDKLYKFINLEELHICNNNITTIHGVDKLVNLQYLDLDNNQIKEIKGLDNLVNLRKLKLSSNKITEIKGLDNLVNLEELQLNYNQITEIKGLDNLVNLKELCLHYNQITEIKELDHLINLQTLSICANKITKIKGLDNLVQLNRLYLHYNQITEIQGLTTLASLQILYLNSNQIKELPLFLCNLINISYIFYYNNPIEYIPLPVQRWLDRLNNRFTPSNMVYNDKQNIHNHHIQNSFCTSLNNILKDKQLLDLITIKQQILENNILTEQTKREILNYCDDSMEHTSLLITYSDLLIYVWSRITFSANKDEILQVLNQEISDGLCMCFTGRLTRLLNTLVGFYDDIELQISDSEQITNIIMSIKNKFPSDQEQLRDAIRKELLDRQYSETIINEWLAYI
jgi:Leucine-rich repeat (LRR) protein